jgi:hypothetical protein
MNAKFAKGARKTAKENGNVAIFAPPWRPLRSFFVFRWFDVSANQRFLPGRTGRLIFFGFIIRDCSETSVSEQIPLKRTCEITNRVIEQVHS